MPLKDDPYFADEMSAEKQERREWFAVVALLTWLVVSVVIVWAANFSTWWSVSLIAVFFGLLIYLGYKWLAIWFEGHDWFVRPSFQRLNIIQHDETNRREMTYKEGENSGER